MKFKTDYFLDIMKELDIDYLYQYLADSKDNFVICIDTIPLMDRNGIPYVYGGLTDVMSAVDELIENRTAKECPTFTTEFHFIMSHCLDVIEKELIKMFLANKATEWDGNYNLYYFSDFFNGEINIDGMTDIVTAFVKDNTLEFLISNENDSKQTYVNLKSFNSDTIMNIVYEIEKG